jgi:histidinol-phosphate aminotransferase
MKHGSLDFEELERLGLDPADILDFSANINPYGPATAVREAVADVPLERYPDRHCLALSRALGDFLGVSRNNVLAGNGTSELILLAALAFIRPGDRVVVIGTTYGEYARAATLMGARVTTYQAQEEADFVPDQAAISGLFKALGPRVAFVCNPNNPTGTALAPDLIAAWAKDYAHTLFVVDEAYLAFAADLGSAMDCAMDNILVLRSMTKDFALAGLRLGYAAGTTRLIAALRAAQPPWSVNALAQAAGVAALRHLDFRQCSLDRLAAAKRELVDEMTLLGLAPVPSAVHFFLVRPSLALRAHETVATGTAFRQALLERGVLVRDCESFGLPEHVRIAARRPEENQRLLAAIRGVI